MTRPRLLDLFCGAGGAARGYQQAGFYVVGVDKEPQPNYCGDEFIQADAIEALGTWDLSRFDAIHASPPCQAFSNATRMQGNPASHPDLLSPTRSLLENVDCHWVIENVPGAPMRPDLRLCGCMFDLGVQRERWFETNWGAFNLRSPCYRPNGSEPVYGHSGPRPGSGKISGRLARWSAAMGIDWMTVLELAQAIPPAYTEYIGRQLLDHLRESGTSTACPQRMLWFRAATSAGPTTAGANTEVSRHDDAT